jgi:hypothetical protein
MIIDSQFKVQARLAQAVSGSNPIWLASYQDIGSGSFLTQIPENVTGSLSGTNWIDLIESPLSGSVRKIMQINLFSSGSISDANLEIALSGSAERTVISTCKLRNNERLSYQNLSGWTVQNNSGSLKLSGAETDSSLRGSVFAVKGVQDNVIEGSTGLELIDTTFSNQKYSGFQATPAGARVDLVLSPGVSGSILATAPDGTATGGNQRGSGSVDFQMVRTQATQVASGLFSVIGGGAENTASGDYSSVGGGSKNTASGDYSAVGGGDSNTATGDYSAVGGGLNNIASGDYSFVGGGSNNTASGHYSFVGGGDRNIASADFSIVPGGQGGLANHTGELAFAPGFFEEIGDAQQSWIGWNLVTTGSVTGSMDCGGLNERFVLQPSASYGYQIRVVALSGSDADQKVAWWEHIGAARRSGDVSTVEIISGSFTSLSGSDIGLENWNTEVIANTVSGSIDIQVSTDTDDAVIWSASGLMIKNQTPTQSLFIDQFDETIVDNVTAVTGSITVPIPSSTVSGSLLIGYISGISAVGTVTGSNPAEWNNIYSVGSGGSNGILTNLAWRLADGTETANYTWNFTAAQVHPVGKIIAIPSGSFDSISPIESNNMFSSGSTVTNVTQVIDPLTVTNNDSILLVLGGAGISTNGAFSIVGMPSFGLLTGESFLPPSGRAHVQASSIQKVSIGPTPSFELQSFRLTSNIATTWTRGAVLIRGPSS